MGAPGRLAALEVLKDVGGRAVKADVVVIGGGPNGLAAAALLAKGGLKPIVLERREVVGGAAVTEEFHPGFRASTVAHTAGPLRAKLVVDARPRAARPGVDAAGAARLRATPGWSRPQPVRRPRAHGRRARSLLGAGRGALSRVPRLARRVSPRCSGALLELTPPDAERLDLRDLFPLAGFGWALRRLGREDGQNLLRWGPMAVADFAQEWFETPLMAAVVAARGIHGMLAGPWSAGTTANLLLQAAAGDGNGAGSTVLVKGGLGALTDGARERRARLRGR